MYHVLIYFTYHHFHQRCNIVICHPRQIGSQYGSQYGRHMGVILGAGADVIDCWGGILHFRLLYLRVVARETLLYNYLCGK